jgi:hypothetical protein
MLKADSQSSQNDSTLPAGASFGTPMSDSGAPEKPLQGVPGVTDATRRGLLTILAAGAASVAGASGVALASLPGSADADMLDLAERFQRLYAEYKPLLDADCTAGFRSYALAWERAGYDGLFSTPTREQGERFVAELERAEVECGRKGMEDKIEALNHQLGPICDAIMDSSAHSPAALRAKAMVSIYALDHAWQRPANDLDWNDKAARSIIEAVCRLVGLQVPAEQLDDDADQETERVARGLQASGRRASTLQHDPAVLEAYNEWLYMERKLLAQEMYPGQDDADRFVPCSTMASGFHSPSVRFDGSEGMKPAPASSRAAAVLTAVGVDLADVRDQAQAVA